MIVRLAPVALVAAVLTAGCGYSLAGRGNFLPASIRTIGIPTFENRTPIFDLETQITQKVQSEFIGRGRYDIVPDVTGVDAVLTGEVNGMTIEAASFNDQGIASSYTVTMTARVELRDVAEDRILWENRRLVFRQEYDAQTGANVLDPAALFGQNTGALDRLTTDFARTVVSAILEAF